MNKFKHIFHYLQALTISAFVSSCHNTTGYNPVSLHGTADVAETGRVKELLQDSFWVACAFVAGAFLIAVGMHLMESDRWNRFWKWIESRLTSIFIFVWIAGFCVYSVGMFIEYGDQGDYDKLFSVAWMSVIHAFGMFILESDISAVHSAFHNSLYYMTWFSVVHFAAALVSMLFVIKHFGYNIVAGVHLWLTAHLPGKKDNLYIFWGINRSSYFLAKDIKRSTPESYRILFVKTADDEDSTVNRTGLDRLFSFLSIKNKELKEFKNLRCLSTNAFARLSKCELTDEEKTSGEISILNNKLGLKSVVRLLNKTNRHVHIMMLGEDEESNIKAATNLSLDKDLNEYANDHDVTIHCHARYDSVNRVLENTRYSGKLEIHIVDSAHMAVETLKSSKEPLCLPVDFIDVEKDATVSSPFRSMVIGMGQCGRDAVRFLYEYGSFVQHRQTGTDDACLSGFRCDVFDKSMNTIAPAFRNISKGADVSGINDRLGSDSWHKINLYKADYNDKLFIDFVEENISHENYIVISTKDDEDGITLAVRLLKSAITKGTDMERFRIFVKSYNEEILHYMERIAKHYNESVVKSLGLKENLHPIYIFGKMKDLYTWHNIIDDSICKESYRYYNNYEGINEAESDLGTKWKERRRNKLGTGLPYGFGNLNEIRRMEHQDMENALHRHTKLRLIRKALRNNAETFQDFSNTVIQHERHADNTYGIPVEWQRIMDTVAQTEHLRWNASHEMLGYTYNKNVKKDQRDIKMQHSCLTSWNNLDIPTRGYDYKVVETSLRMWQKEQNYRAKN